MKSLLLHSCCAPCSTHCIELLSREFLVTVFYYNPNIYPSEEYYFRKEEQKRFIERFSTENPVSFIEGDYDPSVFYEMAKGLESAPERGERCVKCYRLRLFETAKKAAELGFDLFATTLTISPQKSAEVLNRVGEEASLKYGVSYYPSNFKKQDGYLRSVRLTEEYNMYRQDYCGCEYSRR